MELYLPKPVAAQSNVDFCGRSRASIAVSKLARLSLVSVVYCQVEISATGRSLVQRSPAEFVCITEFDQVQK
jgi:hypothetical protein